MCLNIGVNVCIMNGYGKPAQMGRFFIPQDYKWLSCTLKHDGLSLLLFVQLVHLIRNKQHTLTIYDCFNQQRVPGMTSACVCTCSRGSISSPATLAPPGMKQLNSPRCSTMWLKRTPKGPRHSGLPCNRDLWEQHGNSFPMERGKARRLNWNPHRGEDEISVRADSSQWLEVTGHATHNHCLFQPQGASRDIAPSLKREKQVLVFQLEGQ